MLQPTGETTDLPQVLLRIKELKQQCVGLNQAITQVSSRVRSAAGQI